MARDEPQVNLRIPAALKDRLDKASDRNKRSLTAEIVARLEESFSKDPAPAIQVDPYTLDLFAEKVGQVLDERERKRAKR
jgi:hypothetical protein